MRGRTPITRQATLNGKRFRSTWPVFNVSVVFPHPARAAPGPPSPWGKALVRAGAFLVHRGPALTFRGPLHTRPGLRPGHPLQAGEGWSPSSVRAFGPATFPVGEGFGPCRGFSRSSGPNLNFQGSPPHPARAAPGPPSPSRRGLEPLFRRCGGTFPQGKVRERPLRSAPIGR